MKRIRIGKDFSMRWEITTDGVAMPLEGRDLTVELKSPIGTVSNIPFRVDSNVIIMTYYGYEQTLVGEYSVTLWENKGKPAQNVVDAVRAFKLVRTSPEEDDFMSGDLQIESVDLGTENFDILTEGGYRAINIDTLKAEALENSVNINGKTYGDESFTITLPKANLDKAGVMGAADVRTLQEHGESIEQMNTSLQGHQSAINSLNTTMDRNSESISQINTTLEEHGDSISRLDSRTREHSNSIAQINTKLGEHTESISELKSSSALHDTNIDAIKAQVYSQGKSIGSIEGKLAEHSESISQASIAIEGNSRSIADIRAKHNSDVDAINDILDEHTQSINATNDVVNGHTSEITSIKSEQNEQNNSISQIKNTLADHEERLVYTESDLVKVREEYNGIISELMKSIGRTQKAFVVETNDSKGYIYVDDVKKTIPANSIKAFRFNTIFGSSNMGNKGISSFRFLVTDTSGITNMGYMFSGYSSLTSLDLSSFDTSAVKDMIDMFQACWLLTSLLLGPNFFKTSAVTSINFGACGKWTNETMVTSLVTNSYDRATAGLNTLTLKLHANTKAALTDEQKAAITSKGYTIA